MASAATDESASCRRFAQAFYDWYVPLLRGQSNGDASDIAIRRKPELFEPELWRALRLDSEAQARAKGELVGLDFDPFVGSQDPAQRYQVRAANSQDGKCSVAVWSSPPAGKQADVVAEVRARNGHWRFANFRYPELKTDLSTVLAQLRAERDAAKRK